MPLTFLETVRMKAGDREDPPILTDQEVFVLAAPHVVTASDGSQSVSASLVAAEYCRVVAAIRPDENPVRSEVMSDRAANLTNRDFNDMVRVVPPVPSTP